MSDRSIFPPEYAELLKERAGQSYCPSNGTEGMFFEEAYCHNCGIM